MNVCSKELRKHYGTVDMTVVVDALSDAVVYAHPQPPSFDDDGRGPVAARRVDTLVSPYAVDDVNGRLDMPRLTDTQEDEETKADVFEEMTGWTRTQLLYRLDEPLGRVSPTESSSSS